MSLISFPPVEDNLVSTELRPVKGVNSVLTLLGLGYVSQYDRDGYNDHISIETDEFVAVPMFEIDLAANYKNNNTNFAVGLKAEHWTNLPDFKTPTHSAAISAVDAGADSMTFIGPYIELKTEF